MFKPRVLSGVQPTGNLHLGNYLGAIRNWVSFQNTHECVYMLADLHAITVPQEPAKLRQSVRESAAALIACGINPNTSIIFPQSAVSTHAELAWTLGCHTPLGWLNRMTQFKDKAGKNKDQAGLGLYSYPVLMAADILTYHATHVPVGEDQKQHLELARDIAGAFNRAYGEEFFPLPEPMIMGEATRVMSLRDGKKKMSKSDESDYSRINLTDDTDTIAQKFKKAKTDTIEGISLDAENRPEIANLITIYAALSDMKKEAVVEQFTGAQTSAFKTALTDLAVAKLSPITAKMRVLLEDVDSLDGILKNGAERANDIAQPILKRTYDLVGFWR